MAEIVKLGQYDANNLASVAFHFGRMGEDAPVLALLGQGADPNAVDRYGFTALARAAQFDRWAVVRSLLGADADPNLANKWGVTALISSKSGEVTRLLLEAGADVNAATTPNRRGMLAGRTAMMSAAERGDVEAVALLLEHGADLGLRDERGCNALMVAAWNEKHDMTRFLLDAGAGVGLVEAALLGDIAQVGRLLTAGADLHREEMANTLRWAAVGGHIEVVALLLDSGAPIEAGDSDGQTALMQAARYGKAAVVRLLLERGADPDAGIRPGGTALAASIAFNGGSSRKVVELLLTHGASPNACDRSGWTALILACMHGDADIVDLLLRHGADPNAFTDPEIMAREEGISNSNALMVAVANGRVEVVKTLLRYGADPLATGEDGWSAMDTARRGLERPCKRAEIKGILPLLEARIREP